MEPLQSPPPFWEPGPQTTDDPTMWEYQHTHLDVRILLQTVAADRLADPDDHDRYDIRVIWAVDVGASNDRLPVSLTSIADARDQIQELMTTITGAYQPENHYYVATALDRVLGREPPTKPSAMDIADDFLCPICGALLPQFVGGTRLEQYRTHTEFLNEIGCDVDHSAPTTVFSGT